MNCQRNWLYLESIFSAPDIQRQLPAEARMFMQVDKSYKDIMRKVNRVPLAIRAATQPGKDTTGSGFPLYDSDGSSATLSDCGFINLC